MKPPLMPISTTAPSLADIEALADAALLTLPAVLMAHLDNLVIQVEDFPDEDTEEELRLDSPYDLLGLYRGHSLPEKSLNDSGATPDLVYLYRRPILDYWCESGETLANVVRHVLIHEIGHHVGFSDDEMEALENTPSEL